MKAIFLALLTLSFSIGNGQTMSRITSYPLNYKVLYPIDSIVSVPEQKDTVSIMILYTDLKTGVLKSAVGYNVRTVKSEIVEVIVDPNKSTYLGNGLWSTTLMATYTKNETKVSYEHFAFLDCDKKPLSKNVIIWQTQIYNP